MGGNLGEECPVTSQAGDRRQASYLGFWPLCLPPFSLGGNSPHRGLSSPTVCARTLKGVGGRGEQGTGEGPPSQVYDLILLFACKIKGVGVRKEMSPKGLCVLGPFTVDP